MKYVHKNYSPSSTGIKTTQLTIKYSNTSRCSRLLHRECSMPTLAIRVIVLHGIQVGRPVDTTDSVNVATVRGQRDTVTTEIHGWSRSPGVHTWFVHFDCV